MYLFTYLLIVWLVIQNVTCKSTSLVNEDLEAEIEDYDSQVKMIKKRQFTPNNLQRPPQRFSQSSFGNNFDQPFFGNDFQRPFSRRPRPPNNNNLDDTFFWDGKSTTTRPRPSTGENLLSTTTSRGFGNTSTQPSQQNPRPIENDCTRRCAVAPNVFNPVCGDDGVSYNNPTRLNCAKNCGIRVKISHYGNCTPQANRVFPNRE